MSMLPPFPDPMAPLADAPAPPPPAEAPLTRTELLSILSAMQAGGPAAAAVAAAPPKPAKPVTKPVPGLFVTHTHEAPGGTVTQTGVVLEVLPGADGSAGFVTVGWFSGVSGPVALDDLETL